MRETYISFTKAHCSVLAVEGLRAAIRDYEEKHGLVSEKETTTEEVVIRLLKHVMNPMAGLDIVRTELVTKIEINEGSVRILIGLPADHQFSSAIKEDILEKVESLWNIEEVNVLFTE
ncbi:iron-sulfur cluster assembly protein [Methanohalophilus sp.]